MSSGSESDDEYVPGEPEQVSEEESADEETEAQYENEQEQKTKKRKASQISKGRKKIKTRNGIQNLDDNEEKEELPEQKDVNPEEEKKREDDLWAKFLEGTDTKPKPVKETRTTPVTNLSDANNKSVNNKSDTKQKDDEKERERRIFDFAGEKIVVENNVVVDKIKSNDSSPSASKIPGPPLRKGAGLSNILDQLNKKNQLSTLEKSKLDWNTFKKDEGIEDEIVSHNKGKAGYLDRKDFLERTELRQYELEREVRMSRRSNR